MPLETRKRPTCPRCDKPMHAVWSRIDPTDNAYEAIFIHADDTRCTARELPRYDLDAPDNAFANLLEKVLDLEESLTGRAAE